MKRKSRFRVIAIDGPAGSGKSTTAQLVSRYLGYAYLNTGAMYRALTLEALKRKIDPRSAKEVSRLARSLKMRVTTSPGSCRVYLNGKDVTGRLRTSEIERAVSRVSSYPKVRRIMVARQRKVARKGDLVVEGRDTTTVVFPQADLKVYLKADLKERTKRVARDLKGSALKGRSIRDELSSRDSLDRSRPVAPLRKARDSFEIDTSKISIDQQVSLVLDLFEERSGREN